MKMLKYGLGGIIISGISYLIFKDQIMDCNDYSKWIPKNKKIKEKKSESELLELENEKQKMEQDKEESITKTKELIVTSFVEMLLDNPDLELESAILQFENAVLGLTLEQFAQTKSRSKDSYLKVYKPFFDDAQDILNF